MNLYYRLLSSLFCPLSPLSLLSSLFSLYPQVCSNDVENCAVGEMSYTQMLNERGGIEADLTVYRSGEEE